MVTLPLYNKILVVLIDLIAIGLAFLVYRNNPKEKLNRVFVLMVVTMFYWVNFAYLARLVGKSDTSLALLFLKIAWFITPLFFILLYFLVIYLLKKENEYRTLSKIVFSLGVISAFVTGLTDLVVKGIDFIYGNLRIVYGAGMLPFLAIISFFIFATLYPLFKQYLRALIEERRKIEYFLVGIFIFYLANFIFNIMFPLAFGIIRFYWLGDYSTILLLGFTSYAIVVRELFGVRVILTQILVGATALLLLWQAIISIPNWLEFAWKTSLFALFLVFGYFLIQSVIREIQRRAELQKLYQEVERLSQAKSEFISIASHQLRTPLTAIKGYLSMILEGVYGKLAEKAKKPMENVYLSNERLIKLVNDLLSVSRIEAGRLELEFEKISIEGVVTEVIEELKIKAQKKNLDLKLEKLTLPLAKILIDRDKIRQVILNVIDNAIRYTQKGGVTVKIQDLKSKIQIAVSDTGEGMTKEELAKIFETFSRGTAGTQLFTEGAGLGLYIAKKFVELHQGKIWAESRGKDKGSTFFIELPMR